MTRRRKSASILKRVGIGALVVIIVLLLLYIIGAIYFRNHFVIGTSINGVNCSMKSIAGAEEKISKVVQNYEFTLLEREDKQETMNGNTFDMDVVFDHSMNGLLEQQSSWKWPLSFRNKADQAVGVTVEYDQSKLLECIRQLDCMDESNMAPPVSATIEYNTEKKQYEIVDEVLGNTIDESRLEQMVINCVENLQQTLDMDAEHCYIAPEYTKDSEAVVTALNKLNKYVSTEVTYDYTIDKVVVTADEIAEWLVLSDDMEVTFDKEKVQRFVSDMAAKYDTIFKSREFETSYGQTITLTQGDYGWWTNRVEERKDLVKFIKAGISGEKEPVYYQKAVKRGSDDIGDTYVEVNLTRQHVILYKNGKRIKESDCVTGNPSSATPSGIYSVTYKDYTYEGHQVQLVGENYASDVNFFIPFSGNVGLHDASWRKAFGGSIYKSNGSHGCVNLPYDMAKAIFDTVDKGMPVIVYEE